MSITKLFLTVLCLAAPIFAASKPDSQYFAAPPDKVWTAAIQVAAQNYAVIVVDKADWLFTFESPSPWIGYNYLVTVSFFPEGERTKVSVRVMEYIDKKGVAGFRYPGGLAQEYLAQLSDALAVH